ncbi:MAG: hypothetical protein ABIB61_03090 [Candidatus Shapirobacteria bacterium]
MQENIKNQIREAAKITLNKVSSWDDLNAATLDLAKEKFADETRELWKDFAVSGVLAFDKEKGERVLKPFTDLDGNCALGILREAGIDTSSLTYVKPGESLEGAINLDTGDQFGVVYNEETYTAWLDHHKKGVDEITSTAEIVYKTMVGLGIMKQSQVMDRLVKFVNGIDNRNYPPEEFLRSAKTIIGLQRGLKFEQLKAYFEDHELPTDELTPEEFEKYDLRETAERQQKTVDEAMATLEKMEEEGKVEETQYGSVLLNVDNELRVGSSAAYVRHDGIINLAPGKSFAVTFKDKDIDEKELRRRLADRFQGKIIRGKMWIYNDSEPLGLELEDLIGAIK